MVTLYNVISEDGFIATKDGGEDFIPDELWPSTLDFFREFEALIMGHRTYEAIQKYDIDMLAEFENIQNLRKIILTNDLNFKPKEGYEVFHNPEEAIATSQKVLVSSGPELNTYLLRNNLVDEIILWELPGVKINDGIPAFYDQIIGPNLKYTNKFNLVTEIVYIKPHSESAVSGMTEKTEEA